MTAARSPVEGQLDVGAVVYPFALPPISYALLRPLNWPLRERVDGDAERDRLWKAMRVLREFDLPVLPMVAGASLGAAERLTSELLTAGHLVPVGIAAGTFADCPRFRVMGEPGRALPEGLGRG